LLQEKPASRVAALPRKGIAHVPEDRSREGW
jgi:ABC-type uncharacterized transport system ATPase subunit